MDPIWDPLFATEMLTKSKSGLATISHTDQSGLNNHVNAIHMSFQNWIQNWFQNCFQVGTLTVRPEHSITRPKLIASIVEAHVHDQHLAAQVALYISRGLPG